MTPTTFTNHLRKKGLYIKYIGLDAVADLTQVVQAPFPCVAKAGWEDRSKAPSTLKSMGKLIAAGLAIHDLDMNHYEATNKGRKWLNDVIDSGILTP
jgi:hypothetical protein